MAIFDFGSTLLDKFFPDKDEAAKAKVKLIEMQMNGELSKLQVSAGIITAEAKSEHFLVAAWRPITMLVFVFIIANNYIIYPYLSLFWDNAPSLKIPPDMWDLLKIGIGGYTVGRTVEKAVKSYKGN
ncbi:MAG: hypothetical protein COA84_14815 [Robiginitomaculum sp.]|nr:MAG: hypothetical protein COA84_14815 [Robiginitomaculum sp.]